jgi:hypothetical protein
MRKQRKTIPFIEWSEKKKDMILDFITKTGMPISKTALKFNVSTTSLDKLFDERYNKREKKIEEMKKNINLDE